MAVSYDFLFPLHFSKICFFSKCIVISNLQLFEVCRETIFFENVKMKGQQAVQSDNEIQMILDGYHIKEKDLNTVFS